MYQKENGRQRDEPLSSMECLSCAVVDTAGKQSQARLFELVSGGRSGTFNLEVLRDSPPAVGVAGTGAVRNTDGTIATDEAAGGSVVVSAVSANRGDRGVAAHEGVNPVVGDVGLFEFLVRLSGFHAALQLRL